MIQPLEKRIEWFQDARYGMFIHFGIYAVAGRGEQIMLREKMPLQEYEPYAMKFNPEKDWARRLIARGVEAGAKYAVLTARHHDGYCLFNTSTTDFNAVKTGPGRDLVKEYVDAARDAGIRIGLYYSIVNWRWHGLWDPDQYPQDLPAMVAQVHQQVQELMTNYGDIDILWYDVPMTPKKTAANDADMFTGSMDPVMFYRSKELNDRVRQLQPHILINNRSGIPEDFSTPEQFVGCSEPGRAWETCMTVNYAPGWSYLKYSLANKSASEVLYNLIDAVRLGGNYLFNVGPTPEGRFDDREGPIFDQIGQWLKIHGEAIYKTKPEAIYPLTSGWVQGPSFHHGMFTCKGNIAYLTTFRYPGAEMIISGIENNILAAELLTTGQTLQVEALSNKRSVIKGMPASPPETLAPVIKITFDGPPRASELAGAGWLDSGKSTFT